MILECINTSFILKTQRLIRNIDEIHIIDQNKKLLFSNLDDRLVSSQRIMSDFFKTCIARKVISSRFPIGVETIYKVFEDSFII